MNLLNYNDRRVTASRMAAVAVLALCLARGPSAQTTPLEWRNGTTLKPSIVAESAAEAEFTQITSLDVDSHGNIYVADWHRAHIMVLSPDGKLLRSVGRKGSGPGEFQSIRVVQILPGDSLLAYDPVLGRVTVFEPGAAVAKYSLSFPATARRVPFGVQRAPGNRFYLATFRRGYRTGAAPATYRNRKDVVSAYRLEGSLLRDSMLAFPSKEMLTTTYRGQFRITPNPFGEEGFWAVAATGRVHVASSADFLIKTYDSLGIARGSFRVAFDTPPLAEADMRKAITDWTAQTWDEFGPVLLERALKSWPALKGMLVDDAGRLWLLPGGPPTRSNRWVLYSDSGVFQARAEFPADFELRLVRGNRAYGVSTDSDAVPSIVVLTIR